MIPKVGDKVRVNPVFLRQYGICKGIGILMPAYKSQADATELLFPPAPQSRDWNASLTVTNVEAQFWVELAEFRKGIWLEPTGRYAECQNCCLVGCALSEREPFFVPSAAGIVEVTSDQIKRANTIPGIKFCAACGGLLKDPGMGPTYKYCPRCEP